MLEAIRNGLHGLTGTLPIEILECSSPSVLLPNTCAGLLYVLRSPTFLPQHVTPLTYKAIGTGNGVVEDVQRVHARILFDSPGQVGLQAFWLRTAISGFIERNNIDSVGGLYPVLRVHGNEFQPLGQSTKTYKRGSAEIEAHVTLSMEAGRWVQRNHVNRKAVYLELPWDLFKEPKRSVRFDDIDKRRLRSP